MGLGRCTLKCASALNILVPWGAHKQKQCYPQLHSQSSVYGFERMAQPTAQGPGMAWTGLHVIIHRWLANSR